MDSDFTDIKIVSLEDQLTAPSPKDPSLRLIYLKLSQTPPPLWTKTFTDSRKIARHPRWRHAWIDRKFIVIECVPTEIETHHLRDLKQDIATANAAFQKYLAQQGHSEGRDRLSQVIERDKLREMKSRLNFD